MSEDQKIVKVVALERAVNEKNQKLGSFGFSVLGGANSKLPAVVCNVETGGAADISNQVRVGDRLIKLNDEDVTELEPKDLVHRIRGAPTLSTFTLVEDELLRERVLNVIRRHEEKRREKERRQVSDKTDEHLRKKMSSTSFGVRDPRRIPVTKELEVETSVNIVEGQPGEVVRIRGGKIVSEITDDSPSASTPQKSMTASTSVSSEQPSLFSISSGSGGNPDETILTNTSITSEVTEVTEVTEGGAVFIVKKPTTDNGESSKNITQSPGIWKFRKHGTEYKNRSSLNEEVLIDELTLGMTGGTSRGNSKGNSPQKKEEECHTPKLSPSISEKYGINKKKPRDDPFAQAIVLARKLYMLDGFRKSEVAEKLSDQSDFGKMVAREYLNFYEFEGEDLVECLRQFLASFSLTGETQERERVMIHFSQRYFECNPYSFPSYDSVHGVTCALLLLNSDLHTDHGGDKMTLNNFVANLERIGVRIPKQLTKKMYDSIRKRPLESPQVDDAITSSLEDEDPVRVYHVLIPGTFVEVELPENAPVFKEGYLMRKNIMDAAHKKVPRGKRQWKPYYCQLKGFLLYFIPPKSTLVVEDTSNALVVTHCLATRAADYNKKSAVLRITTSDWHAFLLQASNITELQQWIVAFNKAAALYSAPPLAAPIGSGAGFQRPTFPLAPTKNSFEEQKAAHEVKTKSLQKEIDEHIAYKSIAAKNKKTAEWFEKYEFLQFEFNRFHIYLGTLHSDIIMEFKGPLPTGLVPSPSISTLATPGISDELTLVDFRRRSRDASPVPPFFHDRNRKESSPVIHLSDTNR